MVKYLLDTNVVSEMRKGSRCHPQVASWVSGVAERDLCLSVMVLGEVRKGVERLRPKDPLRADALEAWLGQLTTHFGDRVIEVDAKVCDIWGRMNAKRDIAVVDGLQAATAKAHDLTLVTRNDGDLAGLDVTVLNPFTGRTGAPPGFHEDAS